MGEAVTREERAVQVSESLHRWCQANNVRIDAEGFDDESIATVRDNELGALFSFEGIGYAELTADEVVIPNA